jgi:hypothetical protein
MRAELRGKVPSQWAPWCAFALIWYGFDSASQKCLQLLVGYCLLFHLIFKPSLCFSPIAL